MSKFVDRLLRLFFKHVDITKEIDGKEVLYLRRYFIKNGGKGKSHIYLHQIVRSDEDRDPHNHPWRWTTILLKGAYDDEQWAWIEPETIQGGCEAYRHEYCQDGVCDGEGNKTYPGYRVLLGHQHCKAGHIYPREAEHLHRLQLVEGKPVWSLVFTSPHFRTWEFVTEDGPVPWHEYLGLNPETYEAAD